MKNLLDALQARINSGISLFFAFLMLMLGASPVFAQLLTTAPAEAAITSGISIAVTIGAAALTLLATIAAIKWIRGVL